MSLRRHQKMGYQVVYIDETSFCQSVHRPMAYAPVGQRAFAVYDWQPHRKTNVIGALLNNQLLTAGLFEHNINRETFIQWLKLDLLPKLNKKSVLVMDNARFHLGNEIKQLIQQSGHRLLYLPAYSPDLNPIEHFWAYAKHQRRKHMVVEIELLFQLYL